MQYIKLGKIRIPYQVKTVGDKKEFQLGKVKIPFSVSQDTMGEKTYEVFGIKTKLKVKDKIFINRRQNNFKNRDTWTYQEIKQNAEEIFKQKLGYKPNFEEPRSFNEKIFWMKLNYHEPIVTTCCDKYAVKEYITEKIGAEYVVPGIAAWTNVEDVDFSILPDQFALKVNWSTGFNIIVKDKAELDVEKAKERLAHWMKPEQNSYYQAFNWGYKNMKPVIYAEEYLEQPDGEINDYKFHFFNGEMKVFLIAADRKSGNTTYDFFDENFQLLPFTRGGANAAVTPQKPKHYDKMLELATKLAEPFPFVRIDFYEMNDRIYVGEMTFYSGGGILPFEPREWDFKIGEYIKLPIEKQREGE